MRLRAETGPAIELDADKEGLEEEGKALDGKAQAESRAKAAHQPGPQNAELEGQNRAGHSPDRELNRHDHGPSAGNSQRDRILLEDADAVHQQGVGGKRDAEWNHDDVVGEGERQLKPTLKESIGGEGMGE